MTTLEVTQRKSRNGCDSRQLDTLRSLGLRRIGHTVRHEDTPQIRGMIHKVRHLVQVAESADAESAESAGAESDASSPGAESDASSPGAESDASSPGAESAEGRS